MGFLLKPKCPARALSSILGVPPCLWHPPHPPWTVPHHGGSIVLPYEGGPHFPLIQEVGGRIASLHGYGGNFGEAPPPPIPTVIFNQPPPALMGHGVYPSATASVALSLGGASTPMPSLGHVDGWVSLDSNITTSALIPIPPPVVPVPVPWAPTAAVPARPMVVPGPILAAPAAAAVPTPMFHDLINPPVPHVAPFQPLPAVSLGLFPAPALPLAATSQPLAVDAFKLLQLDPIKDVRSYLAMYKVIQLFLCMDMFSTGHADGALTTDAANAAASRVWEFQLCLAVKDGLLHFFLKTRGTSTMAVASKCWLRWTSTAGPNQCRMPLGASCPCLMMSKRTMSRSGNTALTLTGL